MRCSGNVHHFATRDSGCECGEHKAYPEMVEVLAAPIPLSGLVTHVHTFSNAAGRPQLRLLQGGKD